MQPPCITSRLWMICAVILANAQYEIIGEVNGSKNARRLRETCQKECGKFVSGPAHRTREFGKRDRDFAILVSSEHSAVML